VGSTEPIRQIGVRAIERGCLTELVASSRAITKESGLQRALGKVACLASLRVRW
jgi:hypothetical protein